MNSSPKKNSQDKTSALMRTQKMLQMGAKSQIDKKLKEIFAENAFDEDKFALNWVLFVTLEENLDDGIYIVAKSLEMARQKHDPTCEKVLKLKIFECLLKDYGRFPSWRKYYETFYKDIINLKELQEITSHPEEERQFFNQVEQEIFPEDSESDEEKSTIIHVPKAKLKKEN